MELSITDLRHQKRPLWLSHFGVDSYADILGEGGDVWLDRDPSDTERGMEEELTEEDKALRALTEVGKRPPDA